MSRLAATAFAGLALAGCGGDDGNSADDESQIRLVAAAWMNAYAGQDPAACELITPSFQAQAELIASIYQEHEGESPSCEEVAGKGPEPFDSDVIRSAAERIDDAQITIDGDYAIAMITSDAPVSQLFLERSDPSTPEAVGEEVEWLVGDVSLSPVSVSAP